MVASDQGEDLLQTQSLKPEVYCRSCQLSRKPLTPRFDRKSIAQIHFFFLTERSICKSAEADNLVRAVQYANRPHTEAAIEPMI